MFGSDVKKSFTNTEVREILKKIQTVAISVELLPEDARLIYSAGNTSYNHAPEISAEAPNDLSGMAYFRPAFLPRFRAGDSRNVVGRTLAATLLVLEAVEANRN